MRCGRSRQVLPWVRVVLGPGSQGPSAKGESPSLPQHPATSRGTGRAGGCPQPRCSPDSHSVCSKLGPVSLTATANCSLALYYI